MADDVAYRSAARLRPTPSRTRSAHGIFGGCARLPSKLVSDLYVFKFGGDGDGPSPHEAEQARIRPRYVDRVAGLAGLDRATADRVIAAIFDHRDANGRACVCGCHPHFSSTHDDGFDCSCTWDEERRAAERRRWTEWHESAAAINLQRMHAAEEDAIAQWVAGAPGVLASRTSTMCPEQWEGTVDGRSFYFRERHGDWRIELDREPNGRFVDRIAGFDDGEMITEPVELTEGHVIAEGFETELGNTPTAHLDFIVRTIRDYLWAQSCDHAGCAVLLPQMRYPRDDAELTSRNDDYARPRAVQAERASCSGGRAVGARRTMSSGVASMGDRAIRSVRAYVVAFMVIKVKSSSRRSAGPSSRRVRRTSGVVMVVPPVQSAGRDAQAARCSPPACRTSPSCFA